MSPATATVEFRTQVFTFRNGSEQRVAERTERSRFILTFKNLEGYDVATLRDFFRSKKGAFDATWDIEIGAALYHGFAFESDEFIVAELKAERYSVVLNVYEAS